MGRKRRREMKGQRSKKEERRGAGEEKEEGQEGWLDT